MDTNVKIVVNMNPTMKRRYNMVQSIFFHWTIYSDIFTLGNPLVEHVILVLAVDLESHHVLNEVLVLGKRLTRLQLYRHVVVNPIANTMFTATLS